MLYGGGLRVQGVGDIITPLPDEVPEDMSVMTVNGGSDSGKCYAEYDRLFATNEHLYTATDYIPDSVVSAIEHPRNDLEKAATNLNPNINHALMRFYRHYKFSAVSGSGSAVVGIGRYDLFDLDN